MNRAFENIRQRVQRTPMVTILPAIAIGILLADGIGMPLWLAALLLAASLLMAWLWRHPLSALLFIIVVGATSLSLRRSTERIPPHLTEMEIILNHIISEDDSHRTYQADLVAYNDMGAVRRSNATIRAITASAAACSMGERLVVRTMVHPYDLGTTFGEYMAHKGVAGYVRINADNILQRQNYFSLGVWLQEKAKQRIDLLDLRPSTKGIATAISIGERSQITHTERRHYTLSGGAHLLAVSGLHVGFVFVFINLLLLPLAALRNGTLWRTLLSIGFIWCYAAMAALSPSVVRAATMFTLFQLSSIFTSRSVSLNTLCATATLMLLWDGRMLYDIGFLLSLLAVVAIIEWATPMLGQLKSSDEDKLRRLRYMLQHPVRGRLRQISRGLGRWIFTGVTVSFVANIATLPLASLHFGEGSLWGIVVGFAMVTLCSISTTIILTWTLIPIPFLAPATKFIVESCIEAMNSIAEWCADTSFLNFTLHLNTSSCTLIYTALLLLTLALWSIKSNEK